MPVHARFDVFEVDEANASLTREGKPIALAPTPFSVLCALVKRQGALVTKNDLLDEVWGHRFVTESVLKTVIGKLRTALQDDARKPRFIETVSRRGYRFIASTTLIAQGDWTGRAPTHDDAFIGRADALARLDGLWERASHGKRTIAWLAGDPGIGKTTLIERFLAGLGDVACVRGQCVEQYGAGEPYLPVLEALGELCRRDRDAAPMLRAVAPTWLVQLPWLSTPEERDALRRELAGLAGDRMLREMAEFIDRYTERNPLLLVTEDLHWSDRATLQLLDHMARRRGSARFLWLASFRLSEVIAFDHPLNALRRELLLHELCEEIVLDPFSESEVAQYVAQRSPGVAADDAFVRSVHERTDGLPLFVAHVLGDLAKSGQGAEGDVAPAEVSSLAVPERLAAIIDHTIVRLADEERALLSAAAVCGAQFNVDTLVAMLQCDVAGVDAALANLERRRLLVAVPHEGALAAASPTYRFRHALFQQVLYERTTPAVRAALHHKAGAALERERDAGVTVSASELAVHFERGGDAMSAARYLVEAAESALLHFSPGDSALLAEHGLELLAAAAPGPQRDDLEISLATLAGVSASHQLGLSSSQAKAWLQRAYALLGNAPEHRMRALLLHMFGLGVCVRGEYAEALAVAERTQALAEAAGDAVLLRAACMIRGEALMLTGRPREACEWLERGVAATAPGKSDATEDAFVADPVVTMLALLALQLLHLGRVQAARERIAEAYRVARASSQPIAEMIAIWLDALIEVRLGDARRVDSLAAQMEALVEKFALAQGGTASRWFRGWARARNGKPKDGFRLIREGYEENVRLEMLSGGSEVVGYAAEALLLAGDLDGAAAQLDEALGISQSLGERIYLPQLLVTESSIARARGKHRDADASLRRAVAEAQEQQAPWLELMALQELCASDNATARDREALGAVIKRMPEAKDTQAVSKARAMLARKPSRAH